MFAEVRDLESSAPRWLRRWDGILTRSGSQAILQTSRRDFIRSLLAIGKLQHPAIVSASDAGQDGEFHSFYCSLLG